MSNRFANKSKINFYSQAFTLAEVLIAKRESGKVSLLNLSRKRELKAPSSLFLKQCAFTLAEVLITLGIIGVVAALTIPVLIQRNEELQQRTAFKNTYKLLQDASTSLLDENSGSFLGVFSGSQQIYDAYAEKLIFMKNCGTSLSDCWSPSGKTLAGNESQFGQGGWGLNYGILKNGTSLGFQFVDPNCGSRCAQIAIDINGIKPPNTAGLDMFLVAIKTDRLTTITGYGCSKSDPGGRGGWGCANNIIQNMSYSP